MGGMVLSTSMGEIQLPKPQPKLVQNITLEDWYAFIKQYKVYEDGYNSCSFSTAASDMCADYYFSYGRNKVEMSDLYEDTAEKWISEKIPS